MFLRSLGGLCLYSSSPPPLLGGVPLVAAALMMASKDARFHGRKILSLCDNMSAVLALDKGRAGDPSLNGLCRRAAARIIACDITWRRRHVPTEANMTDWGSRAADRKEIPPGCRGQGHVVWLREAEAAA